MKASSLACHLLILVPVFHVVGCSSSGSQSGVADLPIEKCDDTFRCVRGKTSFDATLHRDDAGRCLTGSAEFRPDHHVVSPGNDDGWWSEAPNQFAVCWSEYCTVCTSKSTPPAAPPPTGSKCVGEPDGCYGNVAGSCSEVRGCNFVSHVKWNGTLEYSCEGSADACKEFTDQKSCQRQGCDWK